MEWYLGLTILCAAIIGALILHLILYLVLTLIAEQSTTLWDDVLVAYSKWPLLPLMPLTAIYITIPLVFPNIDQQLLTILRRIIGVFLIISAYWLMSNLSKGVVDEYIRNHQRLSNGHPLSPKELTRIKTTLTLLKRSWEVLCGIFCGIGIIMVLPGADQIGAWLYASVSLIGAFVGVTVQPFMRSLLNVILLSAYEPFALGDELVIAGFCGKVEEIAWDYVVLVQDNDCRRIIPIEVILSNSYETRARSLNGVSGDVQLWVDYKSDVQQWRVQLVNICKRTNGLDWDGRIAKVSVTDCTATAKQLTFTVSAKDWASLDRLKGRVLEQLCLIMSGDLNSSDAPSLHTSNVNGKDASIIGLATKQWTLTHHALPRHRVTTSELVH
ncbi:hypothetical protein BDF22DRAFT_673873 [Syncephalis plumigaleata]|nr:hypothetical protein BDF22DRAFT_673873 [Syncephalis plumigaleata]